MLHPGAIVLPHPLQPPPGSPSPGFCYHSQFFLVLKLYNNEAVQHRAVLLYLTSFAWQNVLEIHASLYTLQLLVLVGVSLHCMHGYPSVWAVSHIYCNFAWVLTFQSPIKLGEMWVDVYSQLPRANKLRVESLGDLRIMTVSVSGQLDRIENHLKRASIV